MVHMWPGLVLFLDNPLIPLDNNATERAARGPVVGRKNHYGSHSLRGTEVAATFYSLVESAKLNGLEPRFYLRVAVRAGLRHETVPLPHEVKADARGGQDRSDRLRRRHGGDCLRRDRGGSRGCARRALGTRIR